MYVLCDGVGAYYCACLSTNKTPIVISQPYRSYSDTNPLRSRRLKPKHGHAYLQIRSRATHSDLTPNTSTGVVSLERTFPRASVLHEAASLTSLGSSTRSQMDT